MTLMDNDNLDAKHWKELTECIFGVCLEGVAFWKGTRECTGDGKRRMEQCRAYDCLSIDDRIGMVQFTSAHSLVLIF